MIVGILSCLGQNQRSDWQGACVAVKLLRFHLSFHPAYLLKPLSDKAGMTSKATVAIFLGSFRVVERVLKRKFSCDQSEPPHAENPRRNAMPTARPHVPTTPSLSPLRFALLSHQMLPLLLVGVRLGWGCRGGPGLCCVKQMNERTAESVLKDTIARVHCDVVVLARRDGNVGFSVAAVASIAVAFIASAQTYIQ